MRWSDQQPVYDSETLADFSIGQGLGVEIEAISSVDGNRQYRLTVGNLFASESVLYPRTQEGLENMLRTIDKVYKRDKEGIQPIGGGTLEPRERRVES